MTGVQTCALPISDTDDINILFIKLNRKGKYVVVEKNYDWILENHMSYSNWTIIEFNNFFKNNSEKLKEISK